MKKAIFLLTVLTVLSLLTACGSPAGGKTPAANTGKTVDDVLKSQMAEENGSAENTGSVPTENKNPETPETDAGSGSAYDVDLTLGSGTVIYSQVYNMLTTPEDYLGKRVKMRGTFSVYTDQNTGKNYFACLIADATACCQQGLEFELSGAHVYPDDYPARGTEVTVEGIFQTYTEGTNRYCYLANAAFCG